MALGAAAAGLAIAPIAAEANTRAGDSARTYSAPASAPGTGRKAEGSRVAGGADIFAFILVGLWATGIAFAVADDGPDQSPGT
ncbi:hypothetical protein [Erythrobacter sp.]|uniref:hypothetical protein n=1 Tax=Erythrobacter sp. TaxID=1042 RepID=UPI0025BD5002|nr:hypothetical protein [Erythrobacter sp.]